MELPWLVGGDFYVILHEDEKIGGLPIHPPKYDDFAFFVNSCGLFDQGYKGSPFTWWNGRSNIECIFKRLDRILVNLPFQNMMLTIEVEHLISTGSDHAPLLITYGEQTTNFVKPFRFLNFWTKHDTFMEPKLKKVKATLSKLSRDTFGDIFKQLAILEDIVRGDRSTSFFHNHVTGKRKKLQLKRIRNGDGAWLEDQVQMASIAIEFYQRQFSKEGDSTDFSLLDNVPTMVTIEQNLELCRFPTLEEAKAAVFELSGDNVCGPDGFTGLFYQTY
ncbi:uncharacterized protein LOC142163253 [Nicotiana tabacum]|uniref:Uncharacterized protein LOC142163253 n=1 Tax=Nicotiana tabacum TaxID=4097 RepID=A0AC58RV59_TOBAC